MVSISRFHGSSPSSGSWCSAASSEQQNRRPPLPRIQQCQIGRVASSICGVSCVQRQNSVKIVRKWKRDKIFWNRLHFCLKFVVITQSASQVTQQETLATGGNTKCTCLSAVPQCSFFTSLLYASVCLGGIYEFHYTSKTTLLRYIFFKGCHYSLLLRYGLKAAVLRYGKNHTFSFLIKLVLLEALVLVPFMTWHHIDAVMKH